jgi:hypothetical protein
MNNPASSLTTSSAGFVLHTHTTQQNFHKPHSKQNLLPKRSSSLSFDLVLLLLLSSQQSGSK